MVRSRCSGPFTDEGFRYKVLSVTDFPDTVYWRETPQVYHFLATCPTLLVPNKTAVRALKYTRHKLTPQKCALVDVAGAARAAKNVRCLVQRWHHAGSVRHRTRNQLKGRRGSNGRRRRNAYRVDCSTSEEGQKIQLDPGTPSEG